MTAVTPRSARERMHRSHRTGAVTWRTSRLSMVGPWSTAAPSRLDSRILVGCGGGDAGGGGGERGLGGRHVRGVERAGDLQLDDPRLGGRRGGELLQPVDGAGGDDLAGAVAVGRVQAGGLDRGEHLGLVAAEHGGHAGGLDARRRRPSRGRARRPASPRRRCVSTPARAAAASSPTLWPATTATSSMRSCSAVSRAAATSSGWVLAVSLISSASASVPR